MKMDVNKMIWCLQNASVDAKTKLMSLISDMNSVIDAEIVSLLKSKKNIENITNLNNRNDHFNQRTPSSVSLQLTVEINKRVIL